MPIPELWVELYSRARSFTDGESAKGLATDVCEDFSRASRWADTADNHYSYGCSEKNPEVRADYRALMSLLRDLQKIGDALKGDAS